MTKLNQSYYPNLLYFPFNPLKAFLYLSFYVYKSCIKQQMANTLQYFIHSQF